MKVFLDYMRLVTETDDEICYAVDSVAFQNVPQDRLASYFDHRLRENRGFLGDPCSKSACKYYGLHKKTPAYAKSLGRAM